MSIQLRDSRFRSGAIGGVCAQPVPEPCIAHGLDHENVVGEGISVLGECRSGSSRRAKRCGAHATVAVSAFPVVIVLEPDTRTRRAQGPSPTRPREIAGVDHARTSGDLPRRGQCSCPGVGRRVGDPRCVTPSSWNIPGTRAGQCGEDTRRCTFTSPPNRTSALLLRVGLDTLGPEGRAVASRIRRP